jgi:tetratricopeptide (TPR) repeat protein
MRTIFLRLIPLVYLLGVLAITLIAYLPGMSAGFYFDDESNLLDVEALHWNELSLAVVERAVNEAMLPTRPLANLSMGLNHLFSGLDPAPYHWTNLFIHLVVGVALYWVIRLFQRHHGVGEGGQWMAVVAVLLFLVHPLNVQAVTYVVQRMTSMATLFFLLGLGSYLAGRHHCIPRRRWGWYGVALTCLLLSIGSKEVGYLLPPMLLLYEFCFHRQVWREWIGRIEAQIGRTTLLMLVVLISVMVLAAGWLSYGDHIYWLQTFPSRDFSGYERVLTQTRVQFFYLSLLLWPLPSRLNLDHAFTLSHSPFDPLSTFIALILVAGIAVYALRISARRPLIAFPILGYLLLHLMESAPIGLELVFEHRMYLPMTMVILFLVLNLAQPLQRNRRLGTSLFLVVIATLALATYQRNKVWGDPLTFYRDCAQKSPTKFRPQYNLGTELGSRGIYGEARQALERAIALRPHDSKTHNQLANVYLLTGEQGRAAQHYRLAVDSEPDNAEALFNLASIYAAQGRLVEQRKMLKKFVQYAPPYLAEQKKWALRFLRR